MMTFLKVNLLKSRLQWNFFDIKIPGNSYSVCLDIFSQIYFILDVQELRVKRLTKQACLLACFWNRIYLCFIFEHKYSVTFKWIFICQKLAVISVRADHMHNLGIKNSIEMCTNNHQKSCRRMFITAVFVLVPKCKLPEYLLRKE